MEFNGLSLKYAFVDFNEREITSLEIVFERVKIFLCDFVKLKMVSVIFPIMSKLDYVALLNLQCPQIAKML